MRTKKINLGGRCFVLLFQWRPHTEENYVILKLIVMRRPPKDEDRAIYAVGLGQINVEAFGYKYDNFSADDLKVLRAIGNNDILTTTLE